MVTAGGGVTGPGVAGGGAVGGAVGLPGAGLADPGSSICFCRAAIFCSTSTRLWALGEFRR